MFIDTKKGLFLEDQSTPLTFLWATTRTYGTDRLPKEKSSLSLFFFRLASRLTGPGR